jgi:hypothetical protein
MDLVLYGRVLWRFRLVVALGLVVGFMLALLSYYSVGLSGGKPKLTPRKAEVYQSQSTMLLTSGKATESPIVPSAAYGALIAYAPYFARLANSDAVKALMTQMNGGKTPNGAANTVPAADTTYGSISSLPGLTTFGTANSPAEARRVTSLAMQAFIKYFTQQQEAAKLKSAQRVNLRIVSEPGNTILIVPRKKTLPIVVFLAIAFATIALAFILENARPGIRVLPAEEPDGMAIKGVRRSA